MRLLDSMSCFYTCKHHILVPNTWVTFYPGFERLDYAWDNTPCKHVTQVSDKSGPLGHAHCFVLLSEIKQGGEIWVRKWCDNESCYFCSVPTVILQTCLIQIIYKKAEPESIYMPFPIYDPNQNETQNWLSCHSDTPLGSTIKPIIELRHYTGATFSPYSYIPSCLHSA